MKNKYFLCINSEVRKGPLRPDHKNSSFLLLTNFKLLLILSELPELLGVPGCEEFVWPEEVAPVAPPGDVPLPV